MPSSLRGRLALFGVLAVLLIPIATSSLHGLTHILSCEERSDTPFSIDLTSSETPVLTSSQVIERQPPGSVKAQTPPGELCGGLTLDMHMTSRDADSAEVVLDITNGTEFGWRGTVQLQLDDVAIPVDIGDIAPGATESDRVTLSLKGERRYDLEGSLLIGP